MERVTYLAIEDEKGRFLKGVTPVPNHDSLEAKVEWTPFLHEAVVVPKLLAEATGKVAYFENLVEIVGGQVVEIKAAYTVHRKYKGMEKK